VSGLRGVTRLPCDYKTQNSQNAFHHLSGDNTRDEGQLTSSNCTLHDASATWGNHETEVSDGSPQGLIPDLSSAAIQNALGSCYEGIKTGGNIDEN